MAPAGPWELAFLFWRRDLFFALTREKIIWFFFSFLVVFLRFLVVISHFWGDFAFWGCFRATRPLFQAQREFFFGFFFFAGP